METIEIKIPSLGESVVEASIARWLKKTDDAVALDEILLEIETDKVTLEITAPKAGILKKIFYTDGQTVQIGDTVGVIYVVDMKAEEKPTPKLEQSDPLPLPPQTTQTPQVETVTVPHDQVISNSMPKEVFVESNPSESFKLGPIMDPALFETASPSVRKRLTEQTQQEQKPLTSLPSQPDIVSSSTHDSNRLQKRIPLSRLRMRIAERLKSAQNTAAILTTFNEIDMSAVQALRDQNKERFEKKHQVKLGFMSFFVKATVKALQEVPILNARIEGQEIISFDYCDIGVAVSTENGLIVPILRDADLLDHADIEKAIMNFSKKAKENKLSLNDLSGGTFSISNGGVFGSLLSTPILNPPQSGILGLHKIQERPVAIRGRVEIRPMMYVALSYDHRLIDGKEAVTFLATIKDYMENPGKFLLDL